jgi:DNA-binding winged helix-turn-helix (wHTH) protein
MVPFPKDAPKRRVIKTLERLGFRLVREHEHISDGARQRRRHADAVDHAQSPKDQGFDAEDDLYASRNCTKRLFDCLQGKLKGSA